MIAISQRRCSSAKCDVTQRVFFRKACSNAVFGKGGGAQRRSLDDLRRARSRPIFEWADPSVLPHLTLADTVAAPVSVNVQLLFLFPPLEQAPDQMALRPPETVNVICVPVVNDADPVLPTVTLMPAGLEVTRWLLRPVAVTVSVAV